MGFLRSTMKFSARIIMNRMNFLQRIFSMSSACLTAMLIRTELMDVSMNTRSFSFLEMTTGVRRSSLLDLTSTSGLLCRSTTCEEKLSRHMAAVRVCLTAARYGLRVALIGGPFLPLLWGADGSNTPHL